jgi:hypothetical protein
MSDTCYNDGIGHECMSKRLGEEPDMRLGDICYLCCCRLCERCEELIDLDCENQIKDLAAHPGAYIDVCDTCLTDKDVLYDHELEELRREEMVQS